MLKYYTYELTFSEVPDEINLCFSITNCQNKCVGCHSPFLRENVGEALSIEVLSSIIEKHKGQFTCVCFLGEGNDKLALQNMISYVHQLGYKTCLYSGRDNLVFYEYENLDYVKTGSYKQDKGPIDRSSTNQKMYKLTENGWEDITFKFWRRVV